jgi:hypothetical protein
MRASTSPSRSATSISRRSRASARHGVWRFCFGENHDTCEPMAGLHEAIQDLPLLASGIRITRPGHADRVACASVSRNYLSVTKSRAAVFAKTAGVRLAGVARPARGRRALDRAGHRARATTPNGGRSTPETCCAGWGSSPRASSGARREKAFMVDQWSIAYRFGGGDGFSGSLDGFFRLDPPKGAWWADPFPIERDGRYWIFFEELPAGAPKAHISVGRGGQVREGFRPVKVLERDYHLSYPFLVEEGGSLFMIPETADNRTVEIYRCVEFRRSGSSSACCCGTLLRRRDAPPRGRPLVDVRQRRGAGRGRERRAAHLQRRDAPRGLEAPPPQSGEERRARLPARRPAVPPRRRALPPRDRSALRSTARASRCSG